MMPLMCPKKFNDIHACPEYFYEMFNKTRSVFNNVKNKYLEQIKSYSDPFLQHVALYLIENYEESKNFIAKNSSFKDNTACDNLNRWFDERKNLFTSSGKCASKISSWNIQIEQLWKDMQLDYPDHTCTRYKRFTNTAVFPGDLNNPICYWSVPENYKCPSPKSTAVSPVEKTCPKCEPIIIPAKCPTIDSPYTSSQVQTQTACDSSHSTLPTIGLSVSSTLLGTAVFLFFLYKFTPLISWLYNRRINNRRDIQYFMEDESFESYERSVDNAYAQSNKGRNYIHYHSSDN
ncbi:PIR protein [Plasmodium ovale]|uniref:PIR Superfamily Protein n=2 Tax=Plasmodium ovale TaxID=36330 RepID=A0A1A8XB65_PLAOA|nr:PIR Superfamily Protein [Plasmodium ovale curtisi]SBT01885.1 PIR Superfamily Protein [Plasmodium ovale curtisi]SBT85162.1 PIR protein [Plasmodium ovale]